jgi:competence protein ComGC
MGGLTVGARVRRLGESGGLAMRPRPGMTFVEILIVAAVAVCLLLVALPKLQRAQRGGQSGEGALRDMKRIEAAKDQYGADREKKTGDPVTMQELIRGGYLRSTPSSLPAGSHLEVGKIGAPVTIAADERPLLEPKRDEHSHEAHEHPEREASMSRPCLKTPGDGAAPRTTRGLGRYCRLLGSQSRALSPLLTLLLTGECILFLGVA